MLLAGFQFLDVLKIYLSSQTHPSTQIKHTHNDKKRSTHKNNNRKYLSIVLFQQERVESTLSDLPIELEFFLRDRGESVSIPQ